AKERLSPGYDDAGQAEDEASGRGRLGNGGGGGGSGGGGGGGGLFGIAEEREGHDLDGTVRRGGHAEKGRAVTVVGSRAEIQRCGLRGLAGNAKALAEQRRLLRGRAAETKQERENSRDERGGRPDAGHHLPGRRPRVQ
ncbi:unnamed protein product, partial [Ectocarpus sp. 12 AP-2014]